MAELDGEPVEVGARFQDGADGMRVLLADRHYAPLSELKFGDATAQAVYDAAGQYDARGAQAFLRNYTPNLPLGEYVNLFNGYYEPGGGQGVSAGGYDAPRVIEPANPSSSEGLNLRTNQEQQARTITEPATPVAIGENSASNAGNDLNSGSGESIINTNIQQLQERTGSAFAESLDATLKKYRVTPEEFDILRWSDVSTLTESEKSVLKAIRESVPAPEVDTLMQKAIPAGDIEKYLDGTYTQVGGFVTRFDDVAHLKTYGDFYESLRLDYPGRPYRPKVDESIGVIRFSIDEASKILTPYGVELGGTSVGKAPFTGNGFTKATNGQIIPEFECVGRLNLRDGAQLIEIRRDGTQTVRAVYSEKFERFIPVKK